MARSPVLTSSTLSPFGGGGGGFGAFSVVNPGREAYLAFLKVKIDWQNGQASNATYLAAFETYVGKQKEGSTTRLEAQQSLDETKYRLERNDLLAKVEAGAQTWDDLVAYDKSKLEGLDHSSQEYLDRLGVWQASQSKALSEAAQDQHDLYEAGKITTAQLRSWYVGRAQDPTLVDNPDLADQIQQQVSSLDIRLTTEADQHMIDMYRDGKVGNDAFLTYATAAKARYAAGTQDEQRWTKVITDAKAQIAERGLTYRYGLSQDYIQLQKFVANERDMLRQAGGGGSTSTSTRIVLGADGKWKTVQSTKSSPYKPSAAEQKAMRQRKIELADAERQLAEWTSKIKKAGGFVTTASMLNFYQGRQADVVKGTDEWYQLQGRIDQLQQQQHAETVLKQEGVRISFDAKVATTTKVKVGGSYSTGTGRTAATVGGGGKAKGQAASSKAGPPASNQGPLEIVTGIEQQHPAARKPGLDYGPKLQTQRSRFPTNLDGSAFQKFYSGFVAAYEQGETTFTDYSSGKAVTYYIPEDLTARAEMVGQLDDLRISYYATRANVYAGTPSEYVAAKEYSDAIKDKADNAYMILVTGQKKGKIVDPTTGPVLDPIEQGLKVKDQAKAYYDQQVRLAKEAWDRGDPTGAWAHLQLATKTAAETEAKMNVYLGAAAKTMSAIYRASGEVAPEKVQKAFEDLGDWQTDFAQPKKAAIDLSNEVAKWVKVGQNGQPVYNADGTLSLHDGAALFVTPDGKVNYQEVPSAGYAAPGGGQQVPDVPGYVRVTVNLGGTVPSQTVYAKWSLGTVGFTADGQPIQGKVVSGFANGQRYTLTEDPFHPGKWNLGNATYKVPPGFKPTETDGVFTFTQNGKNYLLAFDPAKGRYNIIVPGTAFTAEQKIPVSEADAQALLAGAGFGTDLTTVAPGDRWKYNLDQPYAGFTKDQYQKFTTPPPAIGLNGSGSPDDREAARIAMLSKPSLNSSGSPDERNTGKGPLPPGQLFRATGLPFVNETAQTLQDEKMYERQARLAAAQGKPLPPVPASLGGGNPVRPALNSSGSPDQRDEWHQQQIAATAAATRPLPGLGSLSSLDSRDELMAEKFASRLANLTPSAPTTNTGPKSVAHKAGAGKKAATPAPAPKPKTTIGTLPPILERNTAKLKQLELI